MTTLIKLGPNKFRLLVKGASEIGNFKIKLKNPNAQTFIDDFIHDTNFHVVTSTWVKEGLGKVYYQDARNLARTYEAEFGANVTIRRITED